MSSLPEEIPEWARSCPSGKQKFTSADEARRLFRTESRRGVNKSKFKGTPHVYQCPICAFFHFTSTARRRDGRKFGSRWPGGTVTALPGAQRRTGADERPADKDDDTETED